jgi:oligogalacturonide transporter
MTRESWQFIKRACAYGVGDIGNNGSFYIIGLYFTVFLTQVESIPVWWVGIIVLTGKLVDAITDPVMGAITDRTRSKLGRHRVFFVWGALPLVLSYTMLFYSFHIPPGAIGLKICYYLIANSLFSIIYTMVYVPYTAMLPSLSRDYHRRTQIVGIRNVFSCIGCVLPYFVSVIILGNEYSPAASKTPFMLMGFIFSLFFAGSIIITFLFVKEESAAELPAEKGKISLGELYRNYAGLFRCRSYTVYLVMMLCVNCMSGMVIGAYFYYVAYIGAHFQMYGRLFFFHGLTEIAGLPLVYLIARKFGKQLSFRVTMPVIFAGLGGTLLLSPSTAQPWMLYLLALLIGFGVSGIGMVTSNLYSDLTDVDELIYGERREGICSGVATFLRKLILGIAIFLVSVILGFFGYAETPVDWSVAGDGLYPQASGVVTGVRIVFAIIPMILAAVVFVTTFLYKLNAEAHLRIRRAIAEKRERGRVSLSDEDAACFKEITGIPTSSLWIAQNDEE